MSPRLPDPAASTPTDDAATKHPREKIQIEVNGTIHQRFRTSSVADLLETLELGEKRVAVAVNRIVVPRGQYAKVEVADGDRIEILEAVGGG